MTKEDILKIMELVAQVYEEHGKKIVTAELHNTEDDVELLIDNREEKDIH